MALQDELPEGLLEQEVAQFQTCRDTVRNQLESTQTLLGEGLTASLSADFSSRLRENLKLDSVQQRVNLLFQGSHTGSDESSKPCIIIVGQTKSGKSSFINELLGGTFVAQSQSPCTARVTRLTYSDRYYVLVRSKTGQQIGEVKYLEKPPIDEELVKLKDEDRENEALISSTVEAGIKCDFLRHGIDIIDSPGLNENSSLDSLTLGAIDSFLPIIIYVIDSNSGVTLAVQQDLKIIQRPDQCAEVFYLVTKMDVPRETVAEDGRKVEEIEEEKAQRVFAKLQNLGYISKSETRQTCQKFLCVSCWEVRRFRRKREMIEKKRQRNPDAQASATALHDLHTEMASSKWVNHFEEVKMRVLRFAQDQFKNLILSAGSSLRSVHCQILTMFMDKAHDIKESNIRKTRALSQIKELESKIHDQSKIIVERHRDEFLVQTKIFLAQKKPIIMEEIRVMEYSKSMISENMSSSDIKKKCIEEIYNLVSERIVVSFREFLKSGALKRCIEALEILKEKVAEYEKDVEQTPAYQVLKSNLLEGCSLLPDTFVRGGVLSFIANIGRVIKTLFTNPICLLSSSAHLPEWKCLQAKQFFQSIDRETLVDCLIDSIKQWFDQQHDKFLDSIRASELLVESSMKLTEKERSEIKSLYPKVARLYMTTLDVISKYKYRGFRIDLDGNIGSGAQGEVFRVLDQNGEPALAAKRIISDEASLDDIATEVYHSSVLEHRNLIHVVGVKLNKTRPEDKRWTVELYMELMHCDAWTLMQRKSLPLKQRLWIGLELANALVYLHSNDLIHRDVMLANAWVSEDLSQVKLCHFGLVKCADLTGELLGGTPVYMAPELVREANCAYSSSTDIFGLGIALWYLLEGTGTHPEYAEARPGVGPVLRAGLGALDCRPRRSGNTPEALWVLMTGCWSDSPVKRPCAANAVEALQKILDAL